MTETPLEMNVAEAAAEMASGRLTLLDCREQSEWDTVHVPGSTLMPMSEIGHRLAEVDAMTGRPIAVLCHHGMRSMQVMKFLRANGHPTARSVAGGIDAWATYVDPSLTRY